MQASSKVELEVIYDLKENWRIERTLSTAMEVIATGVGRIAMITELCVHLLAEKSSEARVVMTSWEAVCGAWGSPRPLSERTIDQIRRGELTAEDLIL